ncbi:MAG: serine/threonine-protein kinase [Planctomycetota bacterium]
MAANPERALRREEAPPAIPGYELQGFLGRGSSGVVYRARQLAVDREVAIKILHPHMAQESRIVRRLQREARTTARLAHPHIVSAVDMGEVDGRWWYAMEFVDGPSLAQRLRTEGRLREREALRLFIPLCEALLHLWEHGVVHRDIKPANILIDKAGGARLADLGLAVAEDDPSITGTGGTLGTPHYISPEQAVDPRKADVKSDIWSFGATLYHAVCGQPPFAGASAAEVLSGVLYSRIPDPCVLEPTLSKRFALVLRKCLTRDPTRRYQNPNELLSDLERVRERRAPRVRRGSLDPLQEAGERRRRLFVLFGSGLGAAALAALVLWPRLFPADPAAVPGAGEDFGPFLRLDEIEARRARGIDRPAELKSELAALAAQVPPREQARYAALVRAVDDELYRVLRQERADIEDELDRAIHEGDLDRGWHLVIDGLDPRLTRATGYGLAGLRSLGEDLRPWQDRLELKIEAAIDGGLSELEELLGDWRSSRLATADASLVQEDWQRALTALDLPDANAVLSEIGFGIRLPASSIVGLLDGLTLEFRARSERLRDEWQDVDRELKNFVQKRRASLELELGDGPPRIAAEARLRSDFEALLFDRRLTREKMPAGLSRVGLEELEGAARVLAELELALVEQDARDDHAEAEELARDALRTRDYERAIELWEEARERLHGSPRFESSPACAELLRRADLRRSEAVRLEALLVRASEYLRAKDGQEIELRWGSITYPNARLEVGADPRHAGFRAANIPGVLTLAGLASAQLEAFAGLAPAAELAPEERLTLALFRFAEGRFEEAQHAFSSGPLPQAEQARALQTDLAGRLALALERGDTHALERESEARGLLDSVLKPEFRRYSPRIAQARLGRLLDEFGDLSFVKQQRAELQRLEASLEAEAPRDLEREFQRVFAPDRLELSSLGRAHLAWDFDGGRLGAWEGGDWAFDGLGFSLGPNATITAWDQLAAEDGMRLALLLPLKPDSFEFTLRFEALQGEVPARLLWITAAGFQIALGADELPGTPSGARFLVASDDPQSFLQRVMAGQGTRSERLLVPGAAPRELAFKAQRRSGRFELWLDGTLLTTSGLRAPPSEARMLVIRSWGAIRVHGATLEGGR